MVPQRSNSIQVIFDWYSEEIYLWNAVVNPNARANGTVEKSPVGFKSRRPAADYGVLYHVSGKFVAGFFHHSGWKKVQNGIRRLDSS